MTRSPKHVNSSKRPNQDALYQALNIYRDAMRRFILKNLKTVQDLSPKHRFENEAEIDVGDFRYLVNKYWGVFKHRFDPDRDIRSAVGIITEARNKVAHPGTEDIPSEYTRSRLNEVVDILGQINVPKQKREVEAIREKFLARTAPTVETNVASGKAEVDAKIALLKSSVASGEAEVDAKIALKEKEKNDSPKSAPIHPKTNPVNAVINPKTVESEATVGGEWTIDRIKNSLSEEIRKHHEARFSEDRRNIFYKKVAEIQNLIEAQGWRLNPPKLNKGNCAFFLRDKGVTRIRRPFGILLDAYLPRAQPVDRTGKRISDFSIRSNPPRIFVSVTKEEAEHLEREHGCNFFAVSKVIHYNIPENVSELLPVLEFAYRKHSGN